MAGVDIFMLREKSIQSDGHVCRPGLTQRAGRVCTCHLHFLLRTAEVLPGDPHTAQPACASRDGGGYKLPCAGIPEVSVRLARDEVVAPLAGLFPRREPDQR